MGTRSAIAIKHGDTIKAVYCHWDGYVEHNGFILENCYSDSVKVNKLISMGGLSSLGADIGEKHDFGAETEYADIGGMTSVSKACTFYIRDRGESEEDSGFKTFQSEEDFAEYYASSWCEYLYLFTGGEWYISKARTTPHFELVRDVLASKAD